MGFAEFIHNKYTKGVLGLLNIGSIIVIYIFMGIEAANDDTKKEFRGRSVRINTSLLRI